MTNATSDGAGTLCPSAEQRKKKITALRDRRNAVEEELEREITNILSPRGKELRLSRNALNEEIEALESLGDGGPCLTVTLDDFASALVRKALAARGQAEPSDVVNGALVFSLGEDDDHGWPEELDKATSRREAAKEAA